MLNWLLNHLLFAGTMFFAAGSSVVGGDLGGYTDSGGASDGTEGAAGLDDAAAAVETDSSAVEEVTGDVEQKTETAQGRPKVEEDPDAKEFTATVSGRIRNMVKAAPELASVFKAHPEIQNAVEASFRERAAYKELYPTVAEARQMREQFPNGLQDVEALQAEIKEVEQLDQHFYGKDSEGNYPGHTQLIGNMFQDDPKAAVALFRTLPKEWARLDPESYNEVMGSIVGATLAKSDIAGFVGELVDAAKEAKQDSLAANLGKLLNWVTGFSKEKAQPSEAERNLAQREQRLTKEEQQRAERTQQQFHQSFIAESRKIQLAAIKLHPAVKRTLEAQAIPESKKQDILEQIRKAGEAMLSKSPSFMGKLRPAHRSQNLQETINLQRAAWSDQRLMNMIVRRILAKETPQLVAQNRDSIRRRAGTPAKPPVKTGEQQRRPTGPHQVGGRWYKADGTPFTTAEVVSGKHLQG